MVDKPPHAMVRRGSWRWMQFVMKIDVSFRGIACAIGAAVLFGASTPLAKALLPQVSPMLLAGLLYLGSGI